MTQMLHHVWMRVGENGLFLFFPLVMSAGIYPCITCESACKWKVNLHAAAVQVRKSLIRPQAATYPTEQGSFLSRHENGLGGNRLKLFNLHPLQWGVLCCDPWDFFQYHHRVCRRTHKSLHALQMEAWRKNLHISAEICPVLVTQMYTAVGTEQ